MIPKIIHYCWFGGAPLPKTAKRYIKNWKKYCKGYKIIEWNEKNYDLTSAPLYVRQAYKAKKWAFVTDYVRLQVVYEHGGIYLDTDVQLIKPPDSLLDHTAFFGFEDGHYVNTGLGFGAVKGCAILHEMMLDYADIPFIKDDGSFDTVTCPIRNTQILLRHGLKQDDSSQTLDEDILILPSTYLCPYNAHMQLTGDLNKAYSIHWFSASWISPDDQKARNAWLQDMRRDYLRHAPNRFLIRLLGNDRYSKLKQIFKK